MNLTFKGFLRSYCRELTGLQTDNLRKLCKAVATDAPAAAEAVMLFAAVQHRADYLARLSGGTWMEHDYLIQAQTLDAIDDLQTYLESSKVPTRYKKVWNSYLAKRDRILADRRIIELMRQRTLEALEKTSTTVYRLCKDLDMNLGNTYAYLHAGDAAKVSKDTARRILEYADSAS